jgi:predicted transcriptional regulator
MASNPDLRPLLTYFKALADATRLMIVGLLAERAMTGEQLAAILNLRPSTVSHHLAVLTATGLVSARPQSYYNVYSLEAKVLEEMARRLLSPQELSQAALDQVDLDAYDRKVLANFTDAAGRIKTFPAQRKKFEVILRYVLRDFETGVRYSEKQVNEILGRYHEDTATLRRELIGYGWLKRQGGGGEYWLP